MQSKDIIQQFHERAQIENRLVIAAVMRSEAVLSILRRELRRHFKSAPSTSAAEQGAREQRVGGEGVRRESAKMQD